MWPFTKRPQTYYIKRYPECEFDIEGMPVTSIERDIRQDETVIGYRNHKGRLAEWYLPVSPAAHDALVRRFRAKIGQPAVTTSNP